MTGKTHQIVGITTGLAVYLGLVQGAVKYEPATLGMVLLVAHFAALLPDIDQPTAQIWQSLPFGRVMGEATDPFLEHRNITHSLLGVGLVVWLLHWLTGMMPVYWGVDANAVVIAGSAAYASHLILDMFTVEGIPLFFPFKGMFGFPPKPFEGMRIVTGKWFENLVIFPLANLTLLILLWRCWPLIKRIILR